MVFEVNKYTLQLFNFLSNCSFFISSQFKPIQEQQKTHVNGNELHPVNCSLKSIKKLIANAKENIKIFSMQVHLSLITGRFVDVC